MRRYFPFFIIIILLLAITFVSLRVLKVKQVNCTGCDSTLLSQLRRGEGKSLFDSLNYVNKTLMESTRVLKYSVNLTLPFNLNIDVLERDPIAAFKLSNGKYALVDKVGTVKEEVVSTNLPKITSSSTLNADEVIFIANLMNILHTFYNVNEGEINSGGLIINNIKGMTVIFPLTGDTDVLLGSMNLILSRLPSVKEASTIRTLDLRFKNPVLR